MRPVSKKVLRKTLRTLPKWKGGGFVGFCTKLIMAFALTGRNIMSTTIPRAFFRHEASQSAERPWASSKHCPVGAREGNHRKTRETRTDAQMAGDNAISGIREFHGWNSREGQDVMGFITSDKRVKGIGYRAIPYKENGCSL